PPGSREPHRLHDAVAVPAQDPPGSDYALGVRPVRDALHGSTVQARLSVGRVMPAGCRVLHVPLVCAAIAAYACGSTSAPPVSPSSTSSPKKVLVVTHTAGFRHDSINAAEVTIEQLGSANRLFDVS